MLAELDAKSSALAVVAHGLNADGASKTLGRPYCFLFTKIYSELLPNLHRPTELFQNREVV